MRLRLAMIAMAIVIACAIVVARLAHAEHVQVVLLQEADEPAAEASPAAGGGAAGPAADPLRTPAVAAPGVGAAPRVQPPPAAPAPGVVQSPFVQVAPAPVASGAGVASGFTVQVPPPHPNYAQGNAFYPVLAPADDPEANELTSQDQQLEQEVQSLARQLADGSDDKQRADLKDKLAAALEKQFDVQQKLRQLEISRIEARVQKLRDLVRKRTDSRRKIIDGRLEQLLSDAEGLGWNSTKGAGVHFVPYGVPATMPPRPEAPRSFPPATPAPKF
ncbi:MAG TPA: hypothetical protein VG826_08815 [Pirellulales bacterium]|nr:hypothetical protein [Pirellulales bacterium]